MAESVTEKVDMETSTIQKVSTEMYIYMMTMILRLIVPLHIAL
jgi:hypothetical protein